MKKLLSAVFTLLALLAVVAVVLSILRIGDLKPSDGATIFAGFLAFSIVWWQGHLINKQMELQAIIELEKEWNSPEMVKRRRAAWTNQNKPDKTKIESVLEFLEKVSTLEKRGIISADMIWDTFGWYVWRYYHYSAHTISLIRDDWTNKTDATLYCDLEDLAARLLKSEAKYRNKKKLSGQATISEIDVEAELDRTKDKFVSAERTLND